MSGPSTAPRGCGTGDHAEREDDGTRGDHVGGQAPHRALPVDADVPETSARGTRRRVARVFRERWDVLLVIAAGGGLGSLGRWAVNVALPGTSRGFPWATWVENITGGLVLGALMVLIVDFWPPSRYLRPFVGVGILGGYTTFSTYMLDTHTLFAEGQRGAAGTYLFGTLVAGLVAVWVGVLGARAAVTTLERRHARHRTKNNAGANEVRLPAGFPDEADNHPSTRSER